VTSPLIPTETRHDCPVCIREAEIYTAAALAAFERAAELFVGAARSLVARSEEAHPPGRTVGTAPNEERQAQLADWYARSADCSSQAAAIWAERATTHVAGEHDRYLEGLHKGKS
jgi:hypothetical protein